MKKFFITLLATFLILSFTAATEKQNEAGVPAKPQVLWKWGTDLEPTNVNDIVASDSFFLISSKSGILTCVDFQTGSIKWSYLLAGEQLKKPVIENNNIILPGDKTIVCLDKSGKENWKKNFEHLPTNFFVYRNYIIFTQRTLLTCLDSNNGRIIWEQRDVDHIYYCYEIVQLIDDLLYIVPSSYNPTIKCLDPATGKLVFEHRFEKGLSLHSNLAIGQSRIIYVKGKQTSEVHLNKFIFVDFGNDHQKNYYQLKFECLDAKTGKVLWTKPCDFPFDSEYESNYSAEAIRINKTTFYVQDNFYVQDDSYIIHSFDLKDGSWKNSFKKKKYEPYLVEENTYIYKNERIVTKVFETGKQIVVSSLFGAAKQSLMLDNSEYVYLVMVDNKENGQLKCFTKNSGNNLELIWSKEFTGRFIDVFTDLQWKHIAIVGLEKITCFELEESSKIWNLPISTSEFTMNPLISDSHVFTFKDTNITCHDKKTGKQVWSYSASKAFDEPAFSTHERSVPVLSNNESICFNTYENKIICLDQATGKQKWEYNSKRVLSMVQFLDSGSLLVKEWGDVFDLFDPDTGKLLYQFTNMPLRSILVDGNSFCGYFDGKVSFIDTQSKSIAKPQMPPAVAKIFNNGADLQLDFWGLSRNKLLVSIRYHNDNGNENLVCYNTENFEELWHLRIKEINNGKSIQVLDGKILILNDNILSYRDMENGKSIWQKRLNTSIPDHLSMNSDYVYAKDQDKAFCFSTETGKTMWEYEDKKVTTQTGSYQDEMVLCSFGSMTFLKGNLPIKQPLTNKNWQPAYLVFGLTILLGLALIIANVIIRRKKQKPNNQSQEGQAS